MVRRKRLGADKKPDEPQLGPRPKKLHSSVIVSSLPDAVVLNEAQDGFQLDAAPGHKIVVVRHYGTAQGPSVCEVIRVEQELQGYGTVEAWDETNGYWCCFTPMEAAVRPELITVKKLAGARVVLG